MSNNIDRSNADRDLNDQNILKANFDHRSIWILIGALTLLFAYHLLLPLTPIKFNDTLDYSWELALNVCFAEQMQFGKEVLFTYGPYGFIMNRLYYPATFSIMFVSWLFFVTTFWWASFQIGKYYLKKPLSVLIWLLALMIFSALIEGNSAFFISFNVLLIICHFSVEMPVLSLTKILLTVALAWSCLIKFTLFFPAVLIILLITIYDLFRQRSFPYLLSIFIVAIIALWLLAHQKLSYLIDFIIGSLDLSASYSQVMGILSYPREILAYLIIGGIILILVVEMERCVKRWWAIFHLLALISILFLSFKAAFIRHDDHAFIAVTLLIITALTYFAPLWSFAAGHLKKIIATVPVIAAMVLVLYSFNIHPTSNPASNPPFIKAVINRFSAYKALISDRDFYYRTYQANIDEIRNQHPLPMLTGSVDSYPSSQAIILSYGFKYHPRPVLQSHVTYNARANQLNANFLQTDNAPENILFDIEPIDGRYPTIEDSRSWPALFTLYDIDSSYDRFLILKRAKNRRNYQLKPIGQIQGIIGTPFKIPEINSGAVWATINIDLTLMGKLSSLLYRVVAPNLEVKINEGTTTEFSLPIPMAKAGFLLSPLITNREQFAQMASKDGLASLIKSNRLTEAKISLSGQALTYFIKPQFSINFYQLELDY